MIFVTDKGRLANNIFQYGQLYAWGREHGRSTMSMRFAHKYPEFKIAHTRYHHTWVYLLVKLAASLHIIPTINFDGTDNHQIEMLQSQKHALVTGWCVRFPDLFEKYKEEIIRLFDFEKKVKMVVKEKMSKDVPGAIRLGVHIRRGDYVNWLGGRFFCSDEQYISHIQQFISMHPDQEIAVYICGNDPKLDQEKYRQELSDASAVYFPNGTPAEDLCLLSECNYLIGPLSSFTMIASMYHDTPLYWMSAGDSDLRMENFHTFNYQARHFDSYFSNINE